MIDTLLTYIDVIKNNKDIISNLSSLMKHTLFYYYLRLGTELELESIQCQTVLRHVAFSFAFNILFVLNND